MNTRSSSSSSKRSAEGDLIDAKRPKPTVESLDQTDRINQTDLTGSITLVTCDGVVRASKWFLYESDSPKLKYTIELEPDLKEFKVDDTDKEALKIILRAIALHSSELSTNSNISDLTDLMVIEWISQAYTLAHNWNLPEVEKVLGGMLARSTRRISYPILTALRIVRGENYTHAINRFSKQDYQLDNEVKSWEVQEVLRDVCQYSRLYAQTVASNVRNAVLDECANSKRGGFITYLEMGNRLAEMLDTQCLADIIEQSRN
jgi:hypothetical protein